VFNYFSDQTLSKTALCFDPKATQKTITVDFKNNARARAVVKSVKVQTPKNWKTSDPYVKKLGISYEAADGTNKSMGVSNTCLKMK
jgi:hypothetical protein